MTDKEKIRAEIERRIEELQPCNTRENLRAHGAIAGYYQILSFINSMQEESVSEKKCIFTKDSYTDEERKVLCKDCKEKCEYSKKEEPVSEDLEKASKEWLAPQLDKSYANYGEATMMELTHFDGYAMLDAIEFGAQWQKQKMMEEAVEGEITYGKSLAIPSLAYRLDRDGLDFGNKVKVIIIKED